ncbi:MAG: IS5 family transposase [Thermoanaerobaculia bacterium]
MPKPEFTFRYRVRNWPEYNRALVGRGRLTLWFDETAIAGWRANDQSAAPGRPRVYADTTIECALTLKAVFHLSLRATQGFLESVLALLRLELPVPDYSTLSRRQPLLAVTLRFPTSETPRLIVVDSTGMKVYGAGEWHAGKYRRGRRRTWRKLHLGVDETTKEFVAVEVTTSCVHDSTRLPTLLCQVTDDIVQVSADRGYDAHACYESIVRRGAVPTILPRKNARLGSGLDPPAWRTARDENLREIQAQGHYGWRLSTGCTRRSLAENAVSRFKTLFGGRLWARTLESQQIEAFVKCAALNRMTGLGMPASVRVL